MFGEEGGCSGERRSRVKRSREEFPVLVDRLKRGLSKQALQGVMGSDRQVGRQVGRSVDRLGAARQPGENEKIPWQQQHVSYGSRDFSFFSSFCIYSFYLF